MNLNVISNNNVDQNKLKEKKFQLMDLKYIADKEADYKFKALKAILNFKAWRKLYESKTDILDISYSSIEGIVLRQYAEKRIAAYRFVRDARKRSFEQYIKTECTTSYHSEQQAA